jgi:glycosyltransferase involved in cell wall biosynthesis
VQSTEPQHPDADSRPPIASAALSLVLVGHNDASSLRETLVEWQKVLQKRKQPFEILVVDDGSTDDSLEKLNQLSPMMSELTVLRHESRRGRGAALRTGIAVARHPLLCCCTLDGRYQPVDVTRLLEAINPVDLVTGYRAGRRAPRWLRVLAVLGRMVSRAALGIPLEPSPTWLGWRGAFRRGVIRWGFGVFVTDALCDFRLYRRQLFARIPVQADGVFALAEIVAKANFLGAYIAQVPVTCRTGLAGNGDSADLEQPSWRDIRKVLSHPGFGSATAESPFSTEMQPAANVP